MFFQAPFHPFFGIVNLSPQTYVLNSYLGLFRGQCRHPVEGCNRLCLAKRTLFSSTVCLYFFMGGAIPLTPQPAAYD